MSYSGRDGVAADSVRGDGTIAAIAASELPSGIDAAKIADGSVSNAEFQYVNGVTSAIQTQLAAKQPLDGELTAIAGLTSAADKVPYFTGSGTAAVADFSAAGRAIVDDADAAAQRTTLGLGNVENTALSTWAGSTNVTTLGTIGTGTWNATAITAAKLGTHASTHNAGGSDALAIDSAAGTGSLRTLGTASTAACAGNDARLMLGTEVRSNLWGGMQGPGGQATLLLIEDTAYFVYLGRVTTTFTPAYVKCMCGTAGAGAQTAEIGLFSSPAAPNGSSQSLTKIESTGTITSLTSTGVKQNTSAFTTSVPAGTFLWAGIRTNMATTEPTMQAYNRDYARANILTTGTAGALTNAGPWTGATIAATAVTAEAPVMWWSSYA